MMIEDGHGTGYKVHITDEGCMCSKAVTIDFGQHVNVDFQEAYSAIISKTPTAAGDCFFYIVNNGDNDMYVRSITYSAATDETIQVIIKDTGTPAGTTANTLVNRNASSGKQADVTAYDGIEITGLSGGSVVDQIDVDGTVGSKKLRWDSAIVIPKNQTLTMCAVTGGIAVKAVLGIVFHA